MGRLRMSVTLWNRRGDIKGALKKKRVLAPLPSLACTPGEPNWRLQTDGVPARTLGPIQGLVGGVGEIVSRRAILGVGSDAYRKGRVGEGTIVLKGVLFDPAPDLLGYRERLLFGEMREDGLVLVAPEAGRLAASSGVQLPDDAADRADDKLTQEVAVLVVDLLEVIYVGHEDAQGLAHRRHHFQAVLELLVEALLGEQAGEVVAVDQVIQSIMELGLHGVALRKLQYGIADEDAVSVT